VLPCFLVLHSDRRTGVLPHGALIRCLIGYYDPCEPDSSNQTQLSYPPDETMAADESGSHVPYGTLLRAGLGTHQSLGETHYVECFSSSFLLRTISHNLSTTIVVILHIMRAPSRVIDPHRDGFTQALFQRLRMTGSLPVVGSPSLPCLPLERRLEPLDWILIGCLIPGSRQVPAQETNGPPAGDIISGSPTLTGADARPYQPLTHVSGYSGIVPYGRN
jgi:hypothetical protein